MTDKNQYMLIFRGTDWHKGLSPEEMQQVAAQFMAWFHRLTEQKQVVSGNPLENTGKIISGKNGRTVVDGPFAESKEAIGGYFMVQADTLEEAVAIARECPGLAHGIKVEVRPVAATCEMLKDAEHARELAGAI